MKDVRGTVLAGHLSYGFNSYRLRVNKLELELCSDLIRMVIPVVRRRRPLLAAVAMGLIAGCLLGTMHASTSIPTDTLQLISPLSLAPTAPLSGVSFDPTPRHTASRLLQVHALSQHYGEPPEVRTRHLHRLSHPEKRPQQPKTGSHMDVQAEAQAAKAIFSAHRQLHAAENASRKDPELRRLWVRAMDKLRKASLGLQRESAVAAAAGSSSRVSTKVAQKVVLKGGKGGATSKRGKGGEAKGRARYSADASIDNKAFFLASNKINRKSNVIIYGEKADVKHAGGGVGNSGGTGPSGGAGGANIK